MNLMTDTIRNGVDTEKMFATPPPSAGPVVSRQASPRSCGRQRSKRDS
ncbi:MAG TPA: hypothetical protein VKA47_02980 [Solirubrobacterales bacterium]|nr:hypothetical protein [Solirubrobacterales bacterium]